MFLDFEDYRPDPPRVPSAISRREGVLLSMLFHALGVIAYLVWPASVAGQDELVETPAPQESVQYVQVMPQTERLAPPRAEVDASDLDRRATTIERSPSPMNPDPLSRGNTPDKVVGSPAEKMAGPESPVPAPPANTSAPLDNGLRPNPDAPPLPKQAAGGNLGSSLRNLQRYLDNESYDNQRGGMLEQGPDIQFDSKGVEFGPWLRRFVAQVKRNWFIPQAAMFQRGRVVIQFFVLKNGTIIDIRVVQPSPIDAFNIAAVNSLRMSNPTVPLPPEYPDDRAFFTVTYHYNEGVER